ncbi:PQQ-dependent sugar dehydrogenase [Streptomyces aidingensis]|uniref:Glucose/arabinose dehydrogenase, beta-propeller fold n=1 Tax=Streptomyces aidingensis TaxID=910347 RepID=A0A1I1QWQ4_9ACTN|nr:PQQ-dependent sugar dehydrogenase [Streptomyces aidingensis]SFD26509.1 Glucose/arabinose dehydrogenase, beta-propeller fold [Streptomyces aidingensis]
MLRRRLSGPLLLAAAVALPLAVTVPSSATAEETTAETTATETTTAETTATEATAPLEEVTATTTQVASGLQRPTALVAPDDGTGRLFITEKPGTVSVYHPDTGLAEDPLIDLTDVVDESGNERGLLGIALAPDFPQSQELYLAYTALPDGAVTLARYTLTDSSLEVLLQQEHAEYNNHNGGQIAFGPDGYLYLGIGDGGGSGDPFLSGQRLDTLLGKILRIDVNAACAPLAYCIPDDNPFVGTPGAREEIWLYGLRNPWRFSFDPVDGSLWIGDVGQGSWEEFNHLPAGQGGANLGWSCYEGLEIFDETHCVDGEEYTDPIYTYSPYTGGCAVIGGLVYRGEEYADLVGGTYIATDYCSSVVYAIREDGAGGYQVAEIGETPTQITAFGATPEGEFYLVNDLPGGLHRMAFDGPDDPVGGTCEVGYKVNAWGNGLTAEVTITNTGTEPITPWTLEFTLPAGQQVSFGWNAEITQTGSVVTADNASYNATIPPGGSVSMGFLAGHSGDASAPTAFTLNDAACTTAD